MSEAMCNALKISQTATQTRTTDTNRVCPCVFSGETPPISPTIPCRGAAWAVSVHSKQGHRLQHCALYQACTYVGKPSSDGPLVPQAAVVVPKDVSVEVFENRVRRKSVHIHGGSGVGYARG